MSGAELVDRMDRAAATMDFVRLCALARLNWRLIDGGLIGASANRLAQAQQLAMQRMAAAREANRRAEEARLRSNLQTEQVNWSNGQAAIAIGANPSDFMVSTSPASSWSSPVPSGPDPIVQAYTLVHQMLVQSAQLRGGPDPQVAAPLVRAANDILDGRINAAAAVKLMGPAAPLTLRVTAAIPFLGEKLVGPMVKTAAASAMPLGDLYRRMPDALMAGQPAPESAAPAVAIPSLAPPSGGAAAIGFDQLVSAALAQGMATSPDDSDRMYEAAIDAAEKTVEIDDDLEIMRLLARASGDRAPGANVVKRAAGLAGAMAGRHERRDEIAAMVAWVVRAAMARQMSELGPKLLDACKALLATVPGLKPLGPAAAVDLTDATAELLVRSGKADRAKVLLDLIDPKVSDPVLRAALAATRARISIR